MTAILPAETKRPETWGQLLQALRAAGFCDNTHEADEYIAPERFEGETYLEFDHWFDLPIYGENARWVACYWVVGGSEGYYFHADEIRYDAAPARRLVAKFWTWERAQEFTNLAQRLVNG